jgi:signal transduction histidine kinase
MQAMLEAEQDGLADPGEYTDALHRQVRILSSIVDDLFELARIDAGALTLHLEEASLAAIGASCLRGVEAEARAKGVRLESSFDDAAPSVLCAPDKVERVLFNLLANALRHTPSDGAVTLIVRGEAGQLLVAVDDSGEGLGPAAVERMFDSFWRGDAARGDDGAGLGLAIAQGLVRAHGGRIWAENRVGGGARVAFTLPPSVPTAS